MYKRQAQIDAYKAATQLLWYHMQKNHLQIFTLSLIHICTIEKAAEQISFNKKAQQEHSQLESIRNDLHIAQEIQQKMCIRDRYYPE